MNFVHIVIIINQEIRIFYKVVLKIFVNYINVLSKVHTCIIVPADQSAESQNVIRLTAFFLNSKHFFVQLCSQPLPSQLFSIHTVHFYIACNFE